MVAEFPPTKTSTSLRLPTLCRVVSEFLPTQAQYAFPLADHRLYVVWSLNYCLLKLSMLFPLSDHRLYVVWSLNFRLLKLSMLFLLQTTDFMSRGL